MTLTPQGPDIEGQRITEDDGSRTRRHGIVLAYIRTLGPVVTAFVAAIATLVGALVR